MIANNLVTNIKSIPANFFSSNFFQKENEFLLNFHEIKWENKFRWLSPNIRNLFFQNLKRFNHSNFYVGVEMELSNQLNLERILFFYSTNVELTNDIYSMYRIYELLTKKNKIKFCPNTFFHKLFFLFKSFAFSDFAELNQNFIFKEILRFFKTHDYDIKKFDILLSIMQEIDSVYIKKYDLYIIKVVLSYFFFYNDYDIQQIKVDNALECKELTYKVACIYNERKFEPNTVKNLFEQLRIAKYYKCYNYYGELLFTKYNEKEKALSLFREGSKNGENKCYYKFYCASLYFFNFDDILDNKNKLQTRYNKLCFMIDLLINCYSVGNFHNCIDLCLFFKLGCKYCHIKERLQRKYGKYISEIYEFCSEKNYDISNKKKIFIGLLNYYDIIPNVTPDTLKANRIFSEIFYETNEPIFQIYVSYFIYKILKYSNTKLDIEKIIFRAHLNYMIQTPIDELDASFYYSLARLYEKGIGTPKNNCKSYIFYKKAAQYSSNSLATYSLNQYRKYKSIKKLKLKKYQQIETQLNSMSYKTIENIDIEIECTICLNKIKQVVIRPCLHKFCFECLNKIIQNSNNYTKCPICRSIINSYTSIFSNQTRFNLIQKEK